MLGHQGKQTIVAPRTFFIRDSDIDSLHEDDGYDDFIDSEDEVGGMSQDRVGQRAKYNNNNNEMLFDDSGDMKLEMSLTTIDDTSTFAPALETVFQNLSLERPTFASASCSSKMIKISPENSDLSYHNNHNQNQQRTVTVADTVISWISTAYRWERTTDRNFIVESGSGPESDTKPTIIYISRMKLIEKLTTILDHKFMDEVLLTLEMFINVTDFAMILLSRLAQAFAAVPGWHNDETSSPEVVKLRGLIVLQHWIGILSDSGEVPISVRKIVVEGLDYIWQQSLTLSASDRSFIIKIRRLFDPHAEISLSYEATGSESLYQQIPHPQLKEMNGNENVFEGSGEEEDSTTVSASSLSLKWRERLKLRLKAFFTTSSSNSRPSSKSVSSSNPSLLINSFSSEAEEYDDLSSILLGERSRTLAAILAVLESDLFHSIERVEMLSFPSARESPQKLSEECPNLQRLIDHFNSMCQWFVQLISSQEDRTVGTDLLSKIIRLAVKCVLLHNYNSAMQIILTLQSPLLAKRTDLWNGLSSWERRLSKDLILFGSPIRNFRNIRRSTEDEDQDGIVIPFTGLLLSDLVFNWELKADSTSNQHDINFSNSIPIFKAHITSKIVKQFLSCRKPQNRFEKRLNERERQLYSYFSDIGRLGNEFMSNY